MEKESNSKTFFYVLIVIAIILLIVGLCYLFPSESCANTQECSSTQTSPDGSACQDATSTGWWLVGIAIVLFIVAGIWYSNKKSTMMKKDVKTTTISTRTPGKTPVVTKTTTVFDDLGDDIIGEM
jgi:H+/Cl- antiporter ClcA